MKRFIGIVLLSFACVLTMHAQTSSTTSNNRNESWDNVKVTSTEGNDFWVTFMLNTGMRLTGEPPVLHLIGAAREAMTITVEYQATGITENFQIPANGATEFVISPSNNNAVYLDDIGEALTKSVRVYNAQGKLFSLYASNQGSQSYDASIIIPLHGLRKEYVLQTYKEDLTATEFAVIAVENGTILNIIPKQNLDNGTLAGTTLTRNLNKGEVFFARSQSAGLDLSGTVICANKKVAVFNGGQSAVIPQSSNSTNDHIFEQAIPTLNWGKEFAITKTLKQISNVVRVTAAENNTHIYKWVNNSHTQVAVLNSTGTYEYTMGANEQSMYITADKPVITYLYLTSSGENFDETDRRLWGDPSMVMIAPVKQGLNNMIFGTFNGSSFSSLTHYVNITCPTNQTNAMRLDGTNISGQFTPIAGYNQMSFARILVTAGAHRLSNSSAIFNAYVYGIGVAESYAYSAGFDNQPQAAWITIDGERRQEKTICRNRPINFGSVIEYNYDHVDWNFKNMTNGGTDSKPNQTSLSNYQFSSAGDWQVNMIVTRCSPVCPCSDPNTSTGEKDTIRAVIHVKDVYNQSLTARKCEGETVTVTGRNENGQTITKTYRTNTTEDVHFYTVDGCDSIVHVDVKFGKPVTKNISEEACESYTWHGETYTTSGNYTWIGKTAYGCDSTVNLSLTIKHKVIGPTEERTICNGSSITWNGQTISKANTYHATLTAKNGCDSICTLIVRVENAYKDEKTVYICPNETYTWRGQTLSTTKTYTETIPSITSDCDSTFILHLNHYPTYNKTLPLDRCEGETYMLGDTAIKTSGTYTRHLTSIHGCDSTVTINITFHQAETEHIYETICSNETYAFDGKQLNKTGEYTKISQTQYGCGKTTILHLTVNPTTEYKDTVTICPRDIPYTYGKRTTKKATEAGNYSLSYPKGNQYGCDSVYYLHLIVLDNIITNLPPVWHCAEDGPSYSHNNPETTHLHNLTKTGIYRDTLTSSTGCDSILVLDFHYGQRTYSTINKRVCPSDLPWIDENHPDRIGLTRDTTYQDVIQNVMHCDSVITVNFSVAPAYTVTIDTTICEMEKPYMHPDTRFTKFRNLTQSGTYTQSVPSLEECDSTVILNLTIFPTTYDTITTTICAENVPFVYGEHQKKAYTTGIYKDTLITKNHNGCDSVLVVNLTVLDEIRTIWYDTICSDKLPYNHPDSRATHLQGLRETKVYYDTLQSVMNQGCDSILELHLIVGQAYKDLKEEVSLCDNETMQWNDLTLLGSWGAGDTVIIDTLTTYLGCDSIIELTVHIYPTYSFVQTATVCQGLQGEKWEWIDEFGKSHGEYPIDRVGIYPLIDSYTTIHGCDSIYGIELKVVPSYHFHETLHLCENARVEWQGKSYAGDSLLSPLPQDRVLSPDVYYDTVAYQTTATAIPCDSIYYLTLYVHPVYDTIVEMDLCENELPYTYTFTDIHGTHVETIGLNEDDVFPMINDSTKGDLHTTLNMRLTSIHGCDSVVHIHATIHPSYEYYEYAEICWDGFHEWRGNYYTVAGVYFDSLYTETYHCDSVYVLELFVKPVEVIEVYDTICDNEYVYQIDTLWYSETQWKEVETLVWKPGMDTKRPYWDLRFKGLDGCDSIVYRYFVDIHPTYQFDTTLTLCSNEPYNLHANKVVGLGIEYEPMIDGYIPAMDTLFVDTLQTMFGCDSIYTAQATIYPQYRHIDSRTMCDNDSCHWREHIYENLSAGYYVFYDSLTTIHNCDSIYEFQLTITPTYFFEYHDTICDNEDYTLPYGNNLILHGNDLTLHTKDTTYFYSDSTITTHFGCDSVYHVYLTVNPTTDTIMYDTICKTDPYDLHGVMLYESGYYIDTTLNTWGCQHITHLYLEVEDPTKVSIQINPYCEEDIEISYSYEGRNPVSYSLFFDDFGHSQRFKDIEIMPFTADSVVYIPIPYGDVLPSPPTHPTYLETDSTGYNYNTTERREYPRPGLYNITISFQNGVCSDNLIHVDTVIELRFPHWIHEQHWNDGIVIFNEKYNGGYSFDEYQWYHNDTLMPGEIEPYIYLPHELDFSAHSEYKVRLHIVGDAPFDYHFTCPITPTLMPDTIVPLKEYFSVVPTLVHKGADGVDILCNHPGTYSVHTTTGLFICAGKYASCEDGHPATHVPLPQVPDIMYVFKLYSDSGYTRTIKVFHE